MDIGKRIQDLRERRDWTTNRLANMAGLSQSFIRSVELGEKGISVENLELLCDALQISLKQFFDIPTANETIDDLLYRQISALSIEQKKALSTLLTTISPT